MCKITQLYLSAIFSKLSTSDSNQFTGKKRLSNISTQNLNCYQDLSKFWALKGWFTWKTHWYSFARIINLRSMVICEPLSVDSFSHVVVNNGSIITTAFCQTWKIKQVWKKRTISLLMEVVFTEKLMVLCYVMAKHSF